MLSQLPTNKSYGLMELARGTTPQVGHNPEDEVFSWPHLVFREVLLFLLVDGGGAVPGDFLERAAGRTRQPDPSAESGEGAGHFLGLQELVSYSAFWGGVVVPGLLVTALMMLPYLDRSVKASAAGSPANVWSPYNFHRLSGGRPLCSRLSAPFSAA